MQTHTLVWIDHHEARVFGIGQVDDDAKPIRDDAPCHHLRHRTGPEERHIESVEQTFMAEVAEVLSTAKSILIVGPGQARTEFSGYLRDKFPEVEAKIWAVWAVKAMDHPTDAEIVAYGRTFFHASDWMQI